MDINHFLKAKNLLHQASRDFFVQKGFLEIHSPILTGCGGAEIHLDFFETQWIDNHAQSNAMDLRTSPEIYLKTLIARNQLNKVFEIGKCFRNFGEYSRWHRPEFMMLEWYEAGTNLEEMMNTTEQYLCFTYEKLVSLDFFKPRWNSAPFNNIPRWSVQKCFREFLNLNLDSRWQEKPLEFYKELKQKTSNQSIREEDNFETLFFKVMLDEIEPRLKKFPVIFLYNYPASTSALAKLSLDGWARRFEAYVEGVELCNAFDEIVDPMENLKRCQDILSKREKLKNSPKDKLTAQKRFLNQMSQSFEDSKITSMTGNALGLDRWLLLLLGIDFDKLDKILNNPIFDI